MSRLKAPPNVAAVRYGGRDWPVENGYVVVPAMAEPWLTLAEQGFTFPGLPELVMKTQPTLTLKHGRK